MKGNQIIDFIVQAEMPDLEQVREKCHAQAVAKKRQIKRPFVLTAVTLGTVAVLALCLLLGTTLFSPTVSNSFSLNAYALEQQEDGSFQISQTKFDDSGNVWGFGSSGFGSYYKGIFLNLEGNNIQSVEVFAYDDVDYAETHHPTECGDIMFAKQRILMIDGKIIWGIAEGDYLGQGKIFYPTTPFQRQGSRFTLNADELTEDLLLYVGRVRLRGYVSPNLNITVHAVATFTDGTTQEETFFVQ